MKAFEEWWKHSSHLCYDATGHHDSRDAEKAWKAALEWIQSQLVADDFPIDHVIKQELK